MAEFVNQLNPEIVKALDATNVATEALQLPDIEAEITQLGVLGTVFWDTFKKVQATAREHQFTLITSRRDMLGKAFYQERGLPRETGIGAVRRKVTPKLIGHRMAVTELARAVTEHGLDDALERLKTEKLIATLEDTEWGIIYGDADLGPGADRDAPENLQTMGLVASFMRFAPENIIDLEGRPLTLRDIWDAEVRIFQRNERAMPDNLYISPIDHINLRESFYQFTLTSQAERMQGVLGTNATEYLGSYGRIPIHVSRFLGDFNRFDADAVGDPTGEYARPQGTVTVSATAGGSDGDLPEGDYVIAVKAHNFWGTSAAGISNTVSVTAGQKITLDIAYTTSDAYWFEIFVRRADDPTAKFKFLTRVKKAPSGNTTFVYSGLQSLVKDAAYTGVNDTNTYTYKQIPGTGVAFLLDTKRIRIARWLPLQLVNLPRNLTYHMAIRHAINLYSQAWEFSAMFINVGQVPLGQRAQ